MGPLTLERLKKRVTDLVPRRIRETYGSPRVVHHVSYDNAYHCCTQRTASRMLKDVFSDPLFYCYSGLRPLPFTQDPERVQDARIDEPLPGKTIGTNLYIDYSTFVNLPKPNAYKAFFVLRDPRDIVTSWYFSARYSHRPTGLIPKFRKDLACLDLHAGLRYGIDTLWDRGLFHAQLSWMNAAGARVKLFRYEDLAADQSAFLHGILEFLDVRMPADEFDVLYRAHTFEVNSGGRSVGQSDPASHYRMGTAGDWHNHFDRAVTAYFREITGDLLERLGYSD